MPAKPLTDEQKEDAARLRAAFETRKRENPSLTQEALAHTCGWKTQGAVNQYLLGKIPLNLGALLKFSKALDVNPDEISPKLASQMDGVSLVATHIVPFSHGGGTQIDQPKINIHRARLAVLVAEARGVEALAQRAEQDINQVYQWLSGAVDPLHDEVKDIPADVLRKLEEEFGKPPGWMELADNLVTLTPEQQRQMRSVFAPPPEPEIQEERREFQRKFELPPGAFYVASGKEVEVYGKGRGGMTAREFTDQDMPLGGSDKFAEVGTSDPNAFLTPIEGNSMWPKYGHGDYGLVEPNMPIDIEDDVLVRFTEFGPVLKRLLSRRNGMVRLGSYNMDEVITMPVQSIVWMYYVAHPVPAKKIKHRV